MATTSAPGYSGIQPGTRHDPLRFSQEVIDRLVEQSVTNHIMFPTDEIGRCGSSVSYRDAATGHIQEIQNNGHNKPNEVPKPAERQLRITDEWSFHDKYSKQDWEKYMCNDPDFIDDRIDANMELGDQELDKRTIAAMIAGVHRDNQGAKAGHKSHSMNLGTWTAPVNLTPENIDKLFLMLHNIFAEWAIKVHGTKLGQPFVLGPVGLATMIHSNPSLSHYDKTGCPVICQSINGIMPRVINGFDVIETNCMPSYSVPGAGGTTIMSQPILFGFRKASRYTIDFERRDLMNTVPGDRSVHIEGWWEAGYGVVDNRLLGVAAVRMELPSL